MSSLTAHAQFQSADQLLITMPGAL